MDQRGSQTAGRDVEMPPIVARAGSGSGHTVPGDGAAVQPTPGMSSPWIDHPIRKTSARKALRKRFRGTSHHQPMTAGRASMKAREVMTDRVHAFTPDTPADIALQYLHSHGYTAAPVTDEHGNLIGIVTSIDLRTATNTAMRRTRHRRATGALFPSVGDLMITPVGCVTPETDITDIVDMMLDKNIDWLPIVNGHTIVGVITPADLFRAANPPTG